MIYLLHAGNSPQCRQKRDDSRLTKLMEILIPGLLLVAFMVYASTRIKRTAAEAFESETIAGDDFVIQKPEGMLTVLNGRPELLFESYSKEYGKGDAGEIRQIRAELRRHETPETGTRSDETVEVLDGVKYMTSTEQASEKGMPITIKRRAATTSSNSELVLEVKLLDEADEAHQSIASDLMNGFIVK